MGEEDKVMVFVGTGELLRRDVRPRASETPSMSRLAKCEARSRDGERARERPRNTSSDPVAMNVLGTDAASLACDPFGVVGVMVVVGEV